MALPATDSFAQSSGSNEGLTTYSASWTYNQGIFTVPNAISEARSSSSGLDCIAHWNADAFGADQYSQAVLKNVTAGGVFAGVAARADASAATAYVAATDGTQLFIDRYNAGVDTNLFNGAQTFAQSDVIRIEVTGSGANVTITVKRALAASPTSFSVVKTLTDSAAGRLLSGSAGIFGSGDNTSAGGVASFQADNIAATTLITPGVGSISMSGVSPPITLGANTVVKPLTA